MKNIIALVALMIFTPGVFANQIIDGHYDSQKNEVILTIGHGGGCGSHNFYLEYGAIDYKNYQRTVNANLLHITEDTCEGLMVENYIISIGRAVKRPSDLTINGTDGSSITVTID